MAHGSEIKRLREAAGLSQEDLARRLDMSVATVSQWERDVNRPRRRAATDLDIALGADGAVLRLLGYQPTITPRGDEQSDMAAAIQLVHELGVVVQRLEARLSALEQRQPDDHHADLVRRAARRAPRDLRARREHLAHRHTVRRDESLDRAGLRRPSVRAALRSVRTDQHRRAALHRDRARRTDRRRWCRPRRARPRARTHRASAHRCDVSDHDSIELPDPDDIIAITVEQLDDPEAVAGARLVHETERHLRHQP